MVEDSASGVMENFNFEVAESVEETEWEKLKRNRLKEGYAEGMIVGTETAKESGEDFGYVKGFEDSFNYTLSIVMGLLGVNQCILRQTKSPLLSRAKEIKDSLDNFRKKYNIFRVMGMEFKKEDNLKENYASDTSDENSNVSAILNCRTSAFSSTTCKHISHCREETIENLNQLKEDILEFLTECNQPLILDQITQIFEDWKDLLTLPCVCIQNNLKISSSKVPLELT